MKTRRAISTVLGFTTAGLALWAGATGWAQETPSANEPVGKAKPAATRGTAELLDDAAPAGGAGDTLSDRPRNQTGNPSLGRPAGGDGELLRSRMPGNSSFTDRLRNVNPAGEGNVSVTVFGKPDQKRVDEMAEDMRILAYLFWKNLERAVAGDSPDFKLGIPMLLKDNGHSVEASYLEGFGVVLSLRVGFHLVARPGVGGGQVAVPGVSEWDEARRALAGGRSRRARAQANGPPISSAVMACAAGSRSADSPNLVEALKKHTLALLKNASNLRHLKPDEWIVASIAGPPGPTRVVQSRATLRAGAGAGSGQDFVETMRTESDGRPEMMTIRVKKANVDAFAAGASPRSSLPKRRRWGLTWARRRGKGDGGGGQVLK